LGRVQQSSSRTTPARQTDNWQDGIFSPLIKLLIEAALEGEMDVHLTETREVESNRRNSRTHKKISKSLCGALIF